MAEEGTTPDPVELVRRLTEAFSSRNFDGLANLVTTDIVYRPITTWVDSGECRGRDEYRRFAERFWEAWADDAAWIEDTFRVYGDCVIGLFRFSGRAKASGVEVSGGCFAVYRFRDGQIASVDDFTDHGEALRAASVAE